MRGADATRTERARRLRRVPTEAEKKLWNRLRARSLGGHKFARQEPIGPYVVDFVCRGQRLVIEVDGGPETLGLDRLLQAAPGIGRFHRQGIDAGSALDGMRGFAGQAHRDRYRSVFVPDLRNQHDPVLPVVVRVAVSAFSRQKRPRG